MKKVLAILMLSFLIGFTLESCTNESDEDQIYKVQAEDGDITPPEIIVPPGG